MLFSNAQEAGFYDLLEAQASAACEAASLFLALVSDFDEMSMYLQRMEDIEHQADALCRTLVSQMDAQTIIPLDKADLYALSESLDNITDSVEAAAMRMAAFRLSGPRPDLPSLASLLVGITQETHALVRQLRHGFEDDERNAEKKVVMAGIHALEKQSDKTFLTALADLLDDDAIDVRLMLKWKDVYERIEKSVDRCERVASLIASLRLKHT